MELDDDAYETDVEDPDTDVRFNKDTFKVFGACVEANVRMAEFTTNSLISSYEAQIESLSRAFIQLFAAVDEAAEVVTTRSLERALDGASYTYAQAIRNLNKESF